MAHISGLDACKADLYTSDAQLALKYPPDIVEKVGRVRALHQWILSNPGSRDSEVVRECTGRFGVSRPVAYSDLQILKALLPHISEATKDFHKWRYNEMVLLTFEMARRRSDVRTMERAAASYARYNNIDLEQQSDIPVDQIIPQPFIATDDPSVLGIKPVENIRERQRQLIEKYSKESTDIEDIQYEPVDLDEENLFGPLDPLSVNPVRIPDPDASHPASPIIDDA